MSQIVLVGDFAGDVTVTHVTQAGKAELATVGVKLTPQKVVGDVKQQKLKGRVS